MAYEKFERAYPVLTNKVRDLVKSYKDMFPEEYNKVKEIVVQKRADLVSGTGAAKAEHAIGRPLIEFPEVLWTALYGRLTNDEMAVFNTKEGQRWFASVYPAFRIPEHI